MARDAYPVDADVVAFIAAAGIALPSGMAALEGYAEAANREFEQETGWPPFLADADDSTRTFDPPGPHLTGGGYAQTRGGRRVLALRAGLVSLTSIDCGGILPATQYRLLPLNAAVQGKPSSIIEFLVPIFGQAGSVLVTGRWGYSVTVPEDVFQAILRIAASNALKDLSEANNIQNPIKWNRGEVGESFDPDRYGKAGSQWRGYVDRTISRYKRIDQWL